MTRPAIQLHSTRDDDRPLPDVLRAVHRAGFEGVEFAERIQRADPVAVADVLDETGLEPIGAHLGLHRLEPVPLRLLKTYELVGCRRLVVPHLPAVHFRTVGALQALVARFREVAGALEERGFELFYHNTRYDLTPPLRHPLICRLLDRGVVPGPLEGRLLEPYRRQQTTERLGESAIGHLAAMTDASELRFELDAGEVRASGFDHEQVFDWFGDRLGMVHVCDVTGSADGYRSTSPGTGVLDIGSVCATAKRTGVEWLVYEHDHPEDPELTIQRGANAVATRV